MNPGRAPSDTALHVVSRRDFFAVAALAGLGLAGCGTATPRTGAFTMSLRIPPLLEPPADGSGVRRFTLNLRKGRSELLPGLPTTTWGVNGDYLGPTLRAARGDRVAMEVINGIGETTTLHWHGVRLPAEVDGGPHQPIEPGATWTPGWTIDQPATTCWYHPHPHGQTAPHVYRGLAGLFLLDDPEAAALALPSEYGVDDVPLVIQDKAFDNAGAMVEDFGGTFGLIGDTILVNGTFDPYLDVRTERVRFRLLNASNARVYGIGFADRRTFDVIATDGGLLPSPVPADRVVLSPGERLEIVARFAAGEQVLLRSVGATGERANDPEEDDFDLLRIVAAAELRPSPPLPAQLAEEVAVAPAPDATVRRFVLTGSEINGRDMDLSRLDEVVPAGAREIWEIDNTTYAHNFHIHEVAFTILDIDSAPPAPYLQGVKDTVFVPKEAKVRLAVQFGGYPGPRWPYMYHCHMLRHEDRGMMGQFVIVEPGTEDTVPRQIPAPGHHGGG